MGQRTVTATELRAKCFALLDEVASTGETIIVTKRGRPVARLLPAREPSSLLGSVTYNVSEEELIYAPFDEWDVDR
jgi:prevent-host-death family protein